MLLAQDAEVGEGGIQNSKLEFGFGLELKYKNRRYFVKPSAVLHQKKTTLEHKNFLNKKKAQRAASRGDR